MANTDAAVNKEELAIRELIDRFIEAYNSADVDALMSAYTDDLVKMRHKSAPEGKAETAARIRRFFEAFTGHLSVHNDELIILGDAAFVRGELEIIATPRSGGEPQRIRRRFVELWRKDNGTWRVARTMDAEP